MIMIFQEKIEGGLGNTEANLMSMMLKYTMYIHWHLFQTVSMDSKSSIGWPISGKSMENLQSTVWTRFSREK